jgi:hypothetical protein
LCNFLFEAAKKLQQSLNISDVFLITKRLSTGVTDDFILVNTLGKPIRICGVSRISEELWQAVLSFPPFFLFLYDSKTLPETKFPAWREKFGKLLWAEFAKWINV